MKIAARAVRLGGAMFAASAVVAVAPAWAVTVTQVPSSGSLIAVACGSTQSCVAIGQGDGKRNAQSSLIRIDGGAVGAVTKLGTFNPMDVACASGSNCLAVGYTQAGSSISAAVLPIHNGVAGAVNQVPGQVALFGVACPTASTCIAVGANVSSGPFATGAAVDVVTNGVPGAPQTVPGMGQLLGIACPSASDCVAVGTLADSNTAGVITFTNGNPGSPQPVSGAGSYLGLGAVACATTTRCVAVGGEDVGSQSHQGVVVPISNGSPQPVELLPSGPASISEVSGISCPTSTQCLAVGLYQANRPSPTYNVSFPVSATGTLGTAKRTSTAAYSLSTIACPSATDCVYGGGRVVEVTNTITVGVVVTSGNPSETANLSSTLRVRGPGASIPAILRSGGYHAQTTAATAGRLTITWQSRHGKHTVLARGVKKFSAPASATITLRLTAAGRAMLKRSKRVKLTAVGVFAPKHGKTITKRKPVTLRR